MRQITNRNSIQKPLPKAEPKIKIDARVSPKTKQKLIEIAAQKGKNHTTFIREILENYIKTYEL